MRALISGASGLVGRALTRALEAEGHETRGLSRSEKPGVYLWRPERGELDPRALEGIDAVVHLAGESVGAARWNDAVKARILRSRVEGTRTLVRAVLERPEAARPRVFVSASAIGFYGHARREPTDERGEKGEGFLADVCEAWERESEALEESNVRRVVARIGVVLAREGGALEKMRTPFTLGLGGPLGDGSAYFPWVHIDDVVGGLRFAIEHERVRGPMNLVAPGIVTNGAFTRALAQALGRPAFFRVPRFALSLAAGREMAEEMLLADANIVPGALREAGYAFAQPRIEGALASLVKSSTDP